MSDGTIAARWERLRAEGRTALIPYITAGSPDLDATVDAIAALTEAGADFIEVGFPFSDPIADGPVIQRSTHESLAQGTTVRRVLDAVTRVQTDVPLIAFSYLNPILAYGVERFLADADAAGFAGLLLTDLPVGADAAFEAAIRASALDGIRLVAPTTSPDRMRETVAGAEGFLYLIARLGVTGGVTDVSEELEAFVRRVRAATTLPLAVGFGIGTVEQARHVAQFADGVVVGSALVERLGSGGVTAAAAFVRELRLALDGAVVA